MISTAAICQFIADLVSPSPSAEGPLPSVELTHLKAMYEADDYLHRSRGMSGQGQQVLLASMLQRIYQEGVLAGHDRATAIVRRVR